MLTRNLQQLPIIDILVEPRVAEYFQDVSTLKSQQTRDVQFMNDTLEVDDSKKSGGNCSTGNECQGDDSQQ